MYCRTYQTVFKLAIPILPYREPKILNDNDELVDVLKSENINTVLLVADAGINSLGLTKNLEEKIKESGIKLAKYFGTQANPTTDNVDEALKMYYNNNCQALIAFGGGSSMDCTKAVGARVVRPKSYLAK